MKVNRIIPVLLLACLCLVSACQNRQAGAVSNQVKAVDSRGISAYGTTCGCIISVPC